MPLALARKYRPKRFADVAVQSHVSTTLKGAIARGRVAHGYLLCGPRGVGKTTLARVLAMALNCERRGASQGGASADAGEPCGECASCLRIWSGAASLDVVEIDAASNRGVDDARELRERAMYAPSGEDRYKVYIVDEAHMLTREAWNALLKILEEPPPRVVFVFATTEPQKIAQAAAPVLSRLQRFDFKRIGASDIKERLSRVLGAEQVPADTDALAMIARAADGSMRDALSLTDQVLSMGDGRVNGERVREALGLVAEDEYLTLLDIVAERRAGDVFSFVARLADAGVDFGGFMSGLADMLRAQLAVTLGGHPGDLSERAIAALSERRDRLSPGDLLRMLSALSELEPRFRKSSQQQLLLETLLVRFALLDRSVEIGDLLKELGRGPSGGRGGNTAAAPIPQTSEVSRGESASREPGGSSTAYRQRPSDDARVIVADRVSPFGDAETGAPPAPASRRSGDVATAAPALTGSRAPAIRMASELTGEVANEHSLAALDAPSGSAIPDLNRLTERWDELVDRLRADGKKVLAGAVQHAAPVAVTASGELTIALDEPNAFLREALEGGRADVLSILGGWFAGVARITLRREANPAATPKRLTDEMVRTERIAALRKRDPVLGAAIDALDLDVLD